jgi:cyclic pyranopterin phosphate synthase
MNINYLRLSVTDRCNLNCIYCTPLEKEEFLTHHEVLRYEEMARLVGLFTRAGITKVRITGGEPLIKKNIAALVGMINEVPGIEEISMTTNGINLQSLAVELKKAGLARVNISLDTLRKERFRTITGYDGLAEVWAGIEAALGAGLQPVKLNVILLKGINDDEIENFIRLTFSHALTVRFIEFFPTSIRSKEYSDRRVPTLEIMAIVEQRFGKLIPDTLTGGNGPARYYRLPGAQAPMGFISSQSENFCPACNRIRINCAGGVSPCLFSGPLADLRVLLRGGASDATMLSTIQELLCAKSKYTKETMSGRTVEMSTIGG